jgi:hypothetical protein
MNFSTHSSDLDKFSGDYNKIIDFMNTHSLNGLEMIQHADWNPEIIPKSLIQGLHMSFWPVLLDFWNGNEIELVRQFGDEATYVTYYGGKSRSVMVEYYKQELQTALDMGVKYVVFHVSHVELEHCFNEY